MIGSVERLISSSKSTTLANSKGVDVHAIQQGTEMGVAVLAALSILLKDVVQNA